MLRSRIPGVLITVLVLSACSEVRRLPENNINISANDSVFIFGLSPDDHRILVFPGSIDSGGWRQNPWSPATFMGAAKDGFVLSTASAGKTYAVSSIFVHREGGTALQGKMYAPCGDAQTIVFSVPAGKVIYLADLRYTQDGNRLRMDHSADLKKAQEYVDAHYPPLRGRVELGSYELMKTDKACGRGNVLFFATGRPR